MKQEVITAFSSLLAQAEAGGAGGPGGSPMLFQLMFFGMIFLGMWFLVIAPQRKKQKLHAQMLSSLGSGDTVVTMGGIYGTITNVKDDRYIIKIADNTRVEINKNYIHGKVDKAEPVGN